MIENTRNTLFAAMLLIPLLAAAQNDESSVEENVGLLDQTVPVADEEIPAEPEQDTVTEERLLEEFARYRRLLQEGTLDEADVAAKRIVEMAIKVYGPQSRETASALNNLGIVQHSNGQYDAAIQNFTSSVEIIEIVEDRLNNALINPLKGLGAAQLGNGRPDQAQKTFTRATHITHVNEGPHNLDQVEILESLAETYIRLGDTKSARRVLDRIHVVNVKHFEKDPMGLIPSLMNRAAWQHRAGYYAEERASYRRAIRIVESGAGKNDPMLVEPLRRLGESFYYVDVTMATPQQQGLITTGEMYFKRAARIAEDSEDLAWQDLALTKIAMADYYTFTEAQNRARKIYKQVWELLSSDEERIALRTEWFADPVPIRTEALPIYAGGIEVGGTARDDLLAGKIVVDYTVSTRGRVRDLRTEAFPPEFTDMQRMVHREIRRRIFRPRLEEGAPAQSDGLKFEHAFSYLKADLDALRKAEPAPASEDEKEQDGK